MTRHLPSIRFFESRWVFLDDGEQNSHWMLIRIRWCTFSQFNSNDTKAPYVSLLREYTIRHPHPYLYTICMSLNDFRTHPVRLIMIYITTITHTVPISVFLLDTVLFMIAAVPKSASFTRPSVVNRTFPDFISRWIILEECR